MRTIKAFVKDESGASAIEYAFIAMLIALAIVITVGLIGPQLVNIFTIASDGLQMS